MELWKNIESYEGLYQVSNKGRVSSYHNKAKSKILKRLFITGGYWGVRLYKNKSYKCFLIHRLVATAFIPNPQNKREVNHKDGNKSNCAVENLEWVTPSENCLHAYKNGFNYAHRGSEHVRSKLTEAEVLDIKYALKCGRVTGRQLAKSYHVSPSTISAINTGRMWNHVKLSE